MAHFHCASTNGGLGSVGVGLVRSEVEFSIACQKGFLTHGCVTELFMYVCAYMLQNYCHHEVCMYHCQDEIETANLLEGFNDTKHNYHFIVFSSSPLSNTV